VRARISTLVALAVLSSGPPAGAADPTIVAVTVKTGGVICVVRGVETKCSEVALALAKAGATRTDLVSVSSEACGEAALKEARLIADDLKTQGFTKVALVGMLTEPGRVCAA
jgi:biopolymer transport protein ExbD